MKLEKKNYIWGGVILAIILLYAFRKNIMRAFGADEETIQKFCGGGWVAPQYPVVPQYRDGGISSSGEITPRPMPVNPTIITPRPIYYQTPKNPVTMQYSCSDHDSSQPNPNSPTGKQCVRCVRANADGTSTIIFQGNNVEWMTYCQNL